MFSSLAVNMRETFEATVKETTIVKNPTGHCDTYLLYPQESATPGHKGDLQNHEHHPVQKPKLDSHIMVIARSCPYVRDCTCKVLKRCGFRYETTPDDLPSSSKIQTNIDLDRILHLYTVIPQVKHELETCGYVCCIL